MLGGLQLALMSVVFLCRHTSIMNRVTVYDLLFFFLKFSLGYLYTTWYTSKGCCRTIIRRNISITCFVHILIIWCSFLLADIYNKYDTVMYPPHLTKSFLDWVLSVFKSSPVDFKPMDSEKMRQECLHYHLKPFGFAICSEEMFQNYSIVSFSKQILDIHRQMYEMHIHKDGPQKTLKPEVNKVIY